MQRQQIPLWVLAYFCRTMHGQLQHIFKVWRITKNYYYYYYYYFVFQGVCQIMEGCRYYTYNAEQEMCYLYRYRFAHSLNIELDLQSLFGLHVHMYLYSLAVTSQVATPSPHPRIWAHMRERYLLVWWTTSLCDPLGSPVPADKKMKICWGKPNQFHMRGRWK
jgi:hypothetical protein